MQTNRQVVQAAGRDDTGFLLHLLGADADRHKSDPTPAGAVLVITPDQAAEWRQWMTQQSLSEATIKTHCGNAKTIFAEAERRKLVSESPFRYLRSGSTASDNERYVTPDEAERIINALPIADIDGFEPFIGATCF